jgi:hypothetical protein
MGYINRDVPTDGNLSVTIMGQPRPARLLQQPAVDPGGSRIKQ